MHAPGTTAVRPAAARNTPATAVVVLGTLSLPAIAVSVLAAALIAWYANHAQECYRPDGLHQYVECVRRNLSGH